MKNVPTRKRKKLFSLGQSLYLVIIILIFYVNNGLLNQCFTFYSLESIWEVFTMMDISHCRHQRSLIHYNFKPKPWSFRPSISAFINPCTIQDFLMSEGALVHVWLQRSEVLMYLMKQSVQLTVNQSGSFFPFFFSFFAFFISFLEFSFSGLSFSLYFLPFFAFVLSSSKSH